MTCEHWVAADGSEHSFFPDAQREWNLDLMPEDSRLCCVIVGRDWVECHCLYQAHLAALLAGGAAD